MQKDESLTLSRTSFLRNSFLSFVLFLFVFQTNVFAVLMAEGGKEVTVQDPLTDKTTKEDTKKKETEKPGKATSRVPNATLPFSSATPGQSELASAQTAKLNNPAYKPMVIGKSSNATPVSQPSDAT